MTAEPPPEPRPWEDLRDSGMLWLINRCIFHPRGFALAMHFDGEGKPSGWSLLGDGTEVWSYRPDSEEDDCFRRAQATLAALRPEASQ